MSYNKKNREEPARLLLCFFSGYSPPRREGIVTKAITFSDPAISSVDEELGTLVTGNLPSIVDGFSLGGKYFSSSLAITFFDCPSPWMAHDMLCCFFHDMFMD
jgi:hypothetical protein